jgi:DNA-binding NtrC family response regulator
MTPSNSTPVGGSDAKATIAMSETILIIDTDTATREHLQDVLVAHGYAVDVLDSAGSALAAFERTTWPLVIAAFALGDAHGPALVQAIHALAPDTAVILLGDRAQGTALAALRSGAADYLPLPLDENEFVGVLNRVRAARTPCRALQVGADQPIAGAGRQRLVATLAHEINNPLTPIIGLAEMLLEDLPPDHPGRA